MTEPTLFDPYGDKEAAARALDHARRAWVEAALISGRRLARSQTFLTSADVRAGIPETITTHEPRALGGVMRKLQKEGWIVPTDSHRLSKNRVNHNRPMRVWRSVVPILPPDEFVLDIDRIGPQPKAVEIHREDKVEIRQL